MGLSGPYLQPGLCPKLVSTIHLTVLDTNTKAPCLGVEPSPEVSTLGLKSHLPSMSEERHVRLRDICGTRSKASSP